jgi:hypothetical protein
LLVVDLVVDQRAVVAVVAVSSHKMTSPFQRARIRLSWAPVALHQATRLLDETVQTQALMAGLQSVVVVVDTPPEVIRELLVSLAVRAAAARIITAHMAPDHLRLGKDMLGVLFLVRSPKRQLAAVARVDLV